LARSISPAADHHTASRGAATADAAVPLLTRAADGSRCLSFLDYTVTTAGSFGAQLLYRNSINALLLKQALTETLAVLPWFAGRLAVVHQQGGRDAFEVVCTNAGVRLIVASTSTTQQQLAVLLVPEPGSRATGSYNVAASLMAKYALPNDPWVIRRKQLPLLHVYLLQLYGGGSLLLLTVYHGLVDFEGLQTFTAHFSAAYNTVLLTWQQQGHRCNSGSGGNGGCSSCSTCNVHGLNAAGASVSGISGLRDGVNAAEPPLARRGAVFAPASLDALALAVAPPPPDTLPRESFVAIPWWKWGLTFWGILYKLLVQGGGIQVRTFIISPERLNHLKRTATAQLRKGRGEEAQAVAAAAAQGYTEYDGNGSSEEVQQDSSSMIGSGIRQRRGVGGVTEEAGGGGWVSTRDCVTARLAQLLHSLPQRRSRSMFFFVAANMRHRVQPPLLASQLGNILFMARVYDVRPSEMQLGELAARVRLALDRDLLSEYSREWHRVKQLVASHDVRRLVSEMIIDSDPTKCVLSAQGPLVFTDWRVEYPLWKFGSEVPISFTPISFRAPNVVIMCPLSPLMIQTAAVTASSVTATVEASNGDGDNGGDVDDGGGGNRGNGDRGHHHVGVSGGSGGGGLSLQIALHCVAWKRLDKMYGSDLATFF
ncbi:hypothetical protein Vafri_2440, partial [Volvox africanus]